MGGGPRLITQQRGHMLGNAQAGSQARRLDAEQVHQPHHAVQRRPIDPKSAAGSPGPLIFGRTPQ